MVPIGHLSHAPLLSRLSAAPSSFKAVMYWSNEDQTAGLMATWS